MKYSVVNKLEVQTNGYLNTISATYQFHGRMT
jgi:hypothetical protein